MGKQIVVDIVAPAGENWVAAYVVTDAPVLPRDRITGRRIVLWGFEYLDTTVVGFVVDGKHVVPADTVPGFLGYVEPGLALSEYGPAAEEEVYEAAVSSAKADREEAGKAEMAAKEAAAVEDELAEVRRGLTESRAKIEAEKETCRTLERRCTELRDGQNRFRSE